MINLKLGNKKLEKYNFPMLHEDLLSTYYLCLDTEIDTLYLCVIKALSKSQIITKYMKYDFIAEAKYIECKLRKFDFLFVKYEENNIKELDELQEIKRIDGSKYGIDENIWISQEQQCIVVATSLPQEYFLTKTHKVISVYHKIAPWIDTDIFDSKKYKNSYLKKLLQNIAKNIYTESLTFGEKKFETIGDNLRQEIDNILKKSEYSDSEITKKVIQEIIGKKNDNEIQDIESTINSLNSLINDYIIKINETNRELKEQQKKLIYFKYAEENKIDSETYENVMMLFNNENIVIDSIDKEKETISFTIRGNLEYFDQEDFKLVYTKERSKHEPNFNILIDGIINRKVTPKLYASFDFDYNSFRLNINTTKFNCGYIPNTHMMSYNCYGNKSVDIAKCLSKQNFERLLIILCGLTSNINPADGIVFSEFIKQIEKYYYEKPVFEMDGEIVSGIEAVSKLSKKKEKEGEVRDETKNV